MTVKSLYEVRDLLFIHIRLSVNGYRYAFCRRLFVVGFFLALSIFYATRHFRLNEFKICIDFIKPPNSQTIAFNHRVRCLNTLNKCHIRSNDCSRTILYTIYIFEYVNGFRSEFYYTNRIDQCHCRVTSFTHYFFSLFNSITPIFRVPMRKFCIVSLDAIHRRSLSTETRTAAAEQLLKTIVLIKNRYSMVYV